MLQCESANGDVRQTAKKTRCSMPPFLGIAVKDSPATCMVEPATSPTVTPATLPPSASPAARSRAFLSSRARARFDGLRANASHRGAFELAVELRQEILPIILCDTCTGVPRDAWWFEPYHAVVKALPRVTPQNFDYSLGSLALTQHCEKIVRYALQAQLDELNPPASLCARKVRAPSTRYQGKIHRAIRPLER